jgi:hypothetical protein
MLAQPGLHHQPRKPAMSSDRAALRAAAPAPGAPGRAATPASHARAEASRKNGARSRGPKTSAGKARSAQNALKHGLRALGYVVLPDESALEFQALEAALLDELAPVGALQRLLATRVAIAAWRLSRADRIETELFAERRWTPGDPLGLAMIRDGNGTRSFETLMRYRSAALAESVEQPAASAPAPHASTRGSPRPLAAAAPNEPEGLPQSPPEHRLEYVLSGPSGPGRALHEPAAAWRSDEPATKPRRVAVDSGGDRTNPTPANIGAS